MPKPKTKIKNPYKVPPFKAPKAQQAKTYSWWSWHPNYPYWSRSCWGGNTKKEAFASLKSCWASSMSVYHNKLIEEKNGQLIEVVDLPCKRLDVWQVIARDKNGWRTPKDAVPIKNWDKL